MSQGKERLPLLNKGPLKTEKSSQCCRRGGSEVKIFERSGNPSQTLKFFLTVFINI